MSHRKACGPGSTLFPFLLFLLPALDATLLRPSRPPASTSIFLSRARVRAAAAQRGRLGRPALEPGRFAPGFHGPVTVSEGQCVAGQRPGAPCSRRTEAHHRASLCRSLFAHPRASARGIGFRLAQVETPRRRPSSARPCLPASPERGSYAPHPHFCGRHPGAPPDLLAVVANLSD